MSTSTKYIWEARDDEGRWHDFDSFLSFCERNLHAELLDLARREAAQAQVALLARSTEQNRDLQASEKREMDRLDGYFAEIMRVDREITLDKTSRDEQKRKGLGGDGWPPAGSESFFGATARGSLRADGVYCLNDTRTSFFRDVVMAKRDPAAQERLQRNQAEALAERRDITSTTVGGLVPPQYLGDLYADVARPARPLADVIPTQDLPGTGMSFIVPSLTTGGAVAIQTAQNAAVQETDPVESDISIPVVTIAGQIDVSRQSLERSSPGLDFVLFRDLMAAYDSQLDSQLIAGTGSSGQHLGLRAVTSINTVSYTDASPTAAELLPKVYAAISAVASNRYQQADTIVMHPRRAAFLASNLSSTFPLFQVGSLTQASGTQAGGFTTSFGGLRVVLDANIATNRGAGTNEDEILVFNSRDALLMESPLRQVVFEEVLSSTLTIRLQVFAYSAFISSRWPSGIALIQGTGLSTPTFA